MLRPTSARMRIEVRTDRTFSIEKLARPLHRVELRIPYDVLKCIHGEHTKRRA
jgi:hypothetical protein